MSDRRRRGQRARDSRRSELPQDEAKPGDPDRIPDEIPGRIDVTDTPANAVFKLVRGDRAAAEACIALVKTVASADPDAEFGPFTPLLILEATGLVGPAIGHVYRRVCDGDPVTMLALLHALRLKAIAVDTVKRAAVDGTRIRRDTVIRIVQEKIPRFGR
ncbi:hypothetical protein GCM10011611_33140 [Aliidongia dinghuensis]|uniref:Uncharacterized protein n=1 Tax=Aliidongia dinghuensis TaxID=1867774 RepID=A0A8J3E4I5_9PROT|nr:hypothetical protein [Aliidongia dinghuensis]GGF24465.1 hypothetical protein GCM10011611_33140 [Aliidongia dinghuensis]